MYRSGCDELKSSRRMMKMNADDDSLYGAPSEVERLKGSDTVEPHTRAESSNTSSAAKKLIGLRTGGIL